MIVDLRPDHLEIVKRILAERVPEYQVRAFGSRARWMAKDTPDLDLVVMTDAPLGLARLADLREAFSESDLPFRVDVLDWAATGVEFREITEQDYAVIQQPGSAGSSGPIWTRSGMAGEWPQVRIDALGKVVTGKTPSTRDPANFGDEFPFITIPDLNDRVYIDSTRRGLSRQGAESIQPSLLPANAVMMSCIATVGKCGITTRPSFTNQQINSVICNDRVDPRFLYYCFTGLGRRLEAIGSGGSVYTNVSKSRFSELTVPLLPLEGQQAIACILGTLDDKIELNRRMNQTLEGIARAIFKSWFVDFDPVQAKASGEQPPGLAPHIADLFPDAFEASELGEIPKEREVGTVGEDFDITMGQSPPGETYNEDGDGLPFYQGRRDFGFRYPSVRIYCSAPTRFATAGDTLVSVRAPVGDINMAIQDCCIGRGVATVRHKTGSRSYTYYAMRSLRPLFDRFEAEGTVFGSLNKRDFHGLLFFIPPVEIVKSFESRVFPVDQMIEANEQQSQILAALRDTLLPKLISGELRVPDAERIVGRCV